MELAGKHRFNQGQETVWNALTDADVLGRCIPGCQGLKEVEENRYDLTTKLGIGPIRGTFDGSVVLEDIQEPDHFTIKINAKGPAGFANVTIGIDLSADGDGTSVAYNGEAVVGGSVAGVGQRMLGGVAKMIADQFFKALSKEADKSAG